MGEPTEASAGEENIKEGRSATTEALESIAASVNAKQGDEPEELQEDEEREEDEEVEEHDDPDSDSYEPRGD